MIPQPHRWMSIACGLGALAVAVGAFGAHGVPHYLESREFDEAAIAQRLGDFETAARYQMYGALFLLGMSIAADRQPSRGFQVAMWSMLLGVLVFSGAIYAVAIVPDNLRGAFGRFAPVGGGLMIVAWIAAAWGSLRGGR